MINFLFDSQMRKELKIMIWMIEHKRRRRLRRLNEGETEEGGQAMNE